MKPKTEQPPTKICVVLSIPQTKDEHYVVVAAGGGVVGEEYIRHI
jgi:predicted glycosyltransferase